MPVENHICFIAEDLKPFIDLVDQYSSVLYVTQLLIRLTILVKISMTIWYLIAREVLTPPCFTKYRGRKSERNSNSLMRGQKGKEDKAP